jgi:hypothetical protein
MIGKLVLVLCIVATLVTTSIAEEKAQRIADTLQVSIRSPLLTQTIALNITQDATIYLLPGESTSVDFISAYSFEGSNRQWIWIFNGDTQQPTSMPLWQGNVNDYNPLRFPKITMQLKLRNSAGETLTPIITVTLLVSPRITTALPESITATEGEELEVSVGVTPEQRTLFTWGINNKTLPDHASTIKFIPTMEMDGKTLGMLALNPMGAATSTTTLHVKMAPWKIAVIVIFVVLAVGGIAAGALIFLKKKGIIGKKPVEYINTPAAMTGDDDNGLLDDEDI